MRQLHRRLHPRLVAASDRNVLQLATPQLRALGGDRVLARLQPAKPVKPVFCCDCARLSAGGLVAHNHRNAFQGPGVQVGQFAC
jgi:hypothetical protein